MIKTVFKAGTLSGQINDIMTRVDYCSPEYFMLNKRALEFD